MPLKICTYIRPPKVKIVHAYNYSRKLKMSIQKIRERENIWKFKLRQKRLEVVKTLPANTVEPFSLKGAGDIHA